MNKEVEFSNGGSTYFGTPMKSHSIQLESSTAEIVRECLKQISLCQYSHQKLKKVCCLLQAHQHLIDFNFRLVNDVGVLEKKNVSEFENADVDTVSTNVETVPSFPFSRREDVAKSSSRLTLDDIPPFRGFPKRRSLDEIPPFRGFPKRCRRTQLQMLSSMDLGEWKKILVCIFVYVCVCLECCSDHIVCYKFVVHNIFNILFVLFYMNFIQIVKLSISITCLFYKYTGTPHHALFVSVPENKNLESCSGSQHEVGVIETYFLSYLGHGNNNLSL